VSRAFPSLPPLLTLSLCPSTPPTDPPAHIPDAQRARVYQYYVPVFKWVEGQMGGEAKKARGGRPLVLGISAPQGCGKSTLVEQLELLFKW
jgi:hypothetical protein